MTSVEAGPEQRSFVRRCLDLIVVLMCLGLLTNAWEVSRNPVWQQVYLAVGMAAALGLVVWLRLAGSRLDPAVTLTRLYVIIFVLEASSIPVARGGGTVIGIGICVLVLMTAPRGLGGVQAERWLSAAIAIALVASGFDAVELPTHMPAQTNPEFLALTLVGIVLLAAVAATGFRNYTLKIKMVMLFLAMSLAPLLAAALRTHATAEFDAGAHLTAVGVAAGASLAAFYFGGVLARPLNGVVAAMERFAEGDHGARAIVDSGDEVGRLARRFNALAEQLATRMGSLEREVEEARRLGQYTLEELIGRGGMGVVYRAHHALLRRETAIKLLAQDRTQEADLVRFEREVQLTARLTHPHTITIYDFGRTPDGRFYYAMELLEGGSIEDVVAVSGPQPAARVVHVLRLVAGALVEAHGIGLIHRDIKPANIMLCRQGGEDDVPKVLDFGLVKEIDESAGVHATVSRDGRITGTPSYMAPEAITAPDRVDGRSDLYALGSVAYYMLTGRAVFEGGSTIEVLSHHLRTAPVPPSERLGAPLPGELERLILACLEKDPARRPGSAAELRRQLGACEVPAWTPEDASAWWTLHAASVRTRRAPIEAFAGAKTVEVDLDRTQHR